MNKFARIGLLAAAAAVGLTAGCGENAPPPHELHGERFVADSDTRAVYEVSNVQAAAGARDDATLYSMHFDSIGLNALGRHKLDQMLADETPLEPLVVYLDVSKNAAAKERPMVVAYLKDRGLEDSQISLKDGANPDTSHSAQDTITAIHNMQAAPSGAAPAGGPGASASGSGISGGAQSSFSPSH